MSPELLAALELMLVEACVAILAELVVEEVFALSSSPEGVLNTRKCVHLLSAVGECAMFIETTFVDMELTQISHVESLLHILLRSWKVVVYWSREVSGLLGIALLCELWLESGSSNSEAGKGSVRKAVILSLILPRLEGLCGDIWLC